MIFLVNIFAMIDEVDGVLCADKLYKFSLDCSDQMAYEEISMEEGKKNFKGKLKFSIGLKFEDIIFLNNSRIGFLWNSIDELIYKIEEEMTISPIYYMLSYPKLNNESSFRVSQDDSFLAYTAQSNKIIILTNLEEKPKEFSTLFIDPNDFIKDFNFINNSSIVVLTQKGKLIKYRLVKRVSEKEHEIQLNLDSKIQEMPGRLSMSYKGDKIVISTENEKNGAAEAIFLYNLDLRTGFNLVYNSCLGLGKSEGSSFNFMFFDYYIGDYPILFAFPDSNPKVMILYIFYDDQIKKICTVETIHEGSILKVVPTRFHLLSLCDKGVMNAIQIA